MLHVLLRDKIASPVFRLIYDSKIAIDDRDVKSKVQRAIKNVRLESNKDVAGDGLERLEKAAKGLEIIGPATRTLVNQGEDAFEIKSTIFPCEIEPDKSKIRIDRVNRDISVMTAKMSSNKDEEMVAIYKRQISRLKKCLERIAKVEKTKVRSKPLASRGHKRGKVIDGKVDHRRTIWVGNWARAKIKELEQLIYKPKSPPPELLGKWRTIEFECNFYNQKATEEFVSFVRASRWSQYITMKEDQSVKLNSDDRDGGKPSEFLITYKAGDEEMVRKILTFLKGRAYTNESCGTHVHFDMRDQDKKAAILYGKRLARCVPALKTLLPNYRRENKFCKGVINDIDGTANEGRYSFINMQAYTKYKTIEVRGHSGTLMADKILNWIALCNLIMTTRIRFRDKDGEETHDITTAEQLISAYHLDKNDPSFNAAENHQRTVLCAYIRERAAKMNGYGSAANEGESVKVPPPPPPIRAKRESSDGCGDPTCTSCG